MSAPVPERWVRLWREAGAKGDTQDIYGELHNLYSEQHRHYHNWRHILDCLNEFDFAAKLSREPRAIELAIWFHDAVYDTHAQDNEERSADLARKRILGAAGNEALCDAVAALILATKTHDPKAHPDAPILVDVDLTILGQPEARFDEFEKQIRREYEWVPREMFGVKRAEILEGFLARPRIYTNDLFADRYEKPARLNIREAAKKLRAGLF